jgi:hypothetical protein
LPRGLVPAVLLEAGRPRWAGLTDADSTIHLNVASLRANLAQGAPDAVFRTWVHESLHARQPVAIGGEAAVQGYEEGMVEGLTRRVLERYAGLARIGGSFEYYVAGYETLADVFGVDAEQLWRRLWAAPRGDVRARLPAAVQELRHTAGGGTLSVEQLNRLEGVAEAVFQTTRGHDRPGRSRLRELWRVARPDGRGALPGRLGLRRGGSGHALASLVHRTAVGCRRHARNGGYRSADGGGEPRGGRVGADCTAPLIDLRREARRRWRRGWRGWITGRW